MPTKPSITLQNTKSLKRNQSLNRNVKTFRINDGSDDESECNISESFDPDEEDRELEE